MATSIKAGILAGIVLFIWSAISWMVLPWHETTLHHFKDEKAVSHLIQSNAEQSGIYFSPAMQKDGAIKDKELIQGPMIFTAVHLEGMSPSMILPMTISFFSQLIAAIFVAWMLLQTKGLGYVGRVSFVVVFALAAGLVTDIPYWIWFGFDPHYTLVTIADLVIGWYFAGLVLAKFCNNKAF